MVVEQGMAEKKDKSESKGLRSLVGLLKALGIVTAIVVVEVVAASMLVPSGQDAELTARLLASARDGELDDEGAPAGDETNKPVTAELRDSVELELGRYNVTRYNPENDTTLIVDFELYGVVLADDVAGFQSQLERNNVRLREQVIMTLGGADATDLTDPELGLLKRRILEKTNRALGKPIVQEVLFSKFNFVER